MFLLVHVNDIVITGSDHSKTENVIHIVNVEFKLNNLGALNCFFRMDVQVEEDYLLLDQRKYVKELLKENGLFNVSHLPTSQDDGLFIDDLLYQSTFGVLQHVCVTRPYTHFVVNKLSQYMHCLSLSR